MTLGQRRVTSNPVDIGFGKENVYILTRGGLGTEVRVINWEDENLGVRGGADLFQKRSGNAHLACRVLEGLEGWPPQRVGGHVPRPQVVQAE